MCFFFDYEDLIQSVNDEVLIIPIFKAIQEQNQMILSLKALVEQQQTEIEALKLQK
ncbi:MAG: hypothetical protein PHT69_03920 [Bacteroidales bacterium]|nr:hypothetical protein [Bacteroidales bacterium]